MADRQTAIRIGHVCPACRVHFPEVQIPFAGNMALLELGVKVQNVDAFAPFATDTEAMKTSTIKCHCGDCDRRYKVALVFAANGDGNDWIVAKLNTGEN